MAASWWLRRDIQMRVLLTTFMAVLYKMFLLPDDRWWWWWCCSNSFVHCTVDWFVRSTPFCRLIRALFVLTPSNNVLNISDRSKFSCRSCCPSSPCAGSFTTVNKSLHCNKNAARFTQWSTTVLEWFQTFFTFQKYRNNIVDIDDIAFSQFCTYTNKCHVWWLPAILVFIWSAQGLCNRTTSPKLNSFNFIRSILLDHV